MALELALLVLPLFLPGYLLVNVLFPGRGSLGGDLDTVYRIFLGVALSVALTVLYGTLLIMVAGPGQVFLGPETLWPGLSILALSLFLLGVFRGAYPRVARLLGRTPAPSESRAEEAYDLFDRLSDVTARLEAAESSLEAGTEDDKTARGQIDQLRREKRRLEEEAARRA